MGPLTSILYKDLYRFYLYVTSGPPSQLRVMAVGADLSQHTEFQRIRGYLCVVPASEEARLSKGKKVH